MWHLPSFVSDLSRTTTCYYFTPLVISQGASGCVFARTSELISAFFRGVEGEEGGSGGFSIYRLDSQIFTSGAIVCENRRFKLVLRQVQSYWEKTALCVPFSSSLKRLKGMKSITMTSSVICENKCSCIFTIIKHVATRYDAVRCLHKCRMMVWFCSFLLKNYKLTCWIFLWLMDNLWVKEFKVMPLNVLFCVASSPKL